MARIRVACALALMSASAAAPSVAAAQGDPPADYWDPPVVTPAGQPSRVSESPSTTFVITGEEVRRHGATSIPEILRQVPGLEVRMLAATDGQIGPRGFAFEVADRILVMVDGRTAYVDYFGGTAYEMLPVSVLDIDRIEVVLGPGASVYGNKAMLGTINIITRSAAAFPGVEARVEAGPPGEIRAAARHGLVAGNWRTRVTGTLRRLTPYDPAGADPSLAGGGTAGVGFAPRPGLEASVEAGVMSGNTYLLPTGSRVYPFTATLAYARADGRIGLGGPASPLGDLRVKAVWNLGWIRSPTFPDDMDGFRATFHTPYAEATHELRYRLGSVPLQARWGGEVRLNTLRSTITSGERPVWNAAAFAGNEALLGRWRLGAGIRVDRQTLTDVTLSPRLSVVFSPTAAHQLRAAFNTGYNNPNLIQNFADFTVPAGFRIVGSQDLGPERVAYGELAYGGTATRWLRLFANGFAYRITDSLSLDPRKMSGADVPYGNQPAMTGLGGEAGFDFQPSHVISGYAHYAHLRLRADPGHPYQGADNLGSPRHKVSAGIRLDLPRRVYLGADGQYFGAAEVARVPRVPTGSPFEVTPIDRFVMLHARAGIALPSGVDLSVAGTNLFSDGQPQLVGAESPGRRVMATVAYTPWTIPGTR